MKKVKKVMSFMLMYLFMLTLMPMNFIAKQVKALETNEGYCYSGERKYNEKNTAIKNKYNITGDVLSVEQYEDCNVVITNDTIYIIKDGKAIKIPVGIAYVNSNVTRQGKDLYFTPYFKDFAMYNLLKINLDNNKEELIPFKNVKFDYNNELQECNIDKNQNSWFSILQYNRDVEYKENNYRVYKLLRVDSKGKVTELAQLKHDMDIHYDEAFTNMKFDKSNNVWFEVTQTNYVKRTSNYKLGRVSSDGSIKYIDFKEAITNYKITENGEVWVVEGKAKVTKLDNNGKELTNYSLKDVKNISVDKNAGVWVLDENQIKKLEGNKFVVKHSNINNMTNLSVYNDDKIMASNKNEVCMINGKNLEKFEVDNYIKNKTWVVKDNNGKIKILSTPTNAYIYNVWDDTVNICEFLKDGSIKMDKARGINYYGKPNGVYNDEIYFTSINTLYKISRGEKQQVAVLFDDKISNYKDYEYIIKTEINNDGQVYVLTNKSVYMVDKNGKVASCSINKLSKNNNESDKKEFYNLLKVNKGELFTLGRVGDTTRLFKINDINNIQEDSNYILNKDGIKYYPQNIFANENNELELVYRINEEFKVYKRVNNSLVEDIRFNNQHESFSGVCWNISAMKKTSEGDLFLLDKFGTLYIKDKGINYFHMYPVSYVNNIETAEDGSFYIATGYEGLIHYDSKLKMSNKQK